MESQDKHEAGFPQRGRRLPRTIRQQIKKYLIAGYSTDQVNDQVVRLGHDPVAPSTITRYRQHPTVVRGLRQAELDGITSGLALREKQIEVLKELLLMTIDRMMGTHRGKKLPDISEREQKPNEPLPPLTWALLGREAREYIKLIRDLVTESPAAAEAAREQELNRGHEGQDQRDQIQDQLLKSMWLGQLNDALEELVKEHEAQSEAAGTPLLALPSGDIIDPVAASQPLSEDEATHVLHLEG